MEAVVEALPNVCGTFESNFMITEMADDPIRRDYGVFNAYDHEHPENITQIYVSSPEVPRWRWQQSMAATQCVLEAVRGRSLHFPKLVKAGRLIFGSESIQEPENDPETSRIVLILKNTLPYALVSNLIVFSPNGCLPTELALQVGWGMVRALAALHRCGFVHRLVSPHSFSYLTPPTVDSLVNRLLITDMSLCMPWPRKPRVRVPFTGTMRYSALKAHQGREQGPSTDIQSVIFVVAEMISGRLPWRSVTTLRTVRELKEMFPDSHEFRRLPNELRKLYRDMMNTSPQFQIDYQKIQMAFKTALSRRDPSKTENLPPWLALPSEE